MPEVEAETYAINPFDLTKVWPQQDYPLIEVGEMVLNRNPENYFAEVEQAAFAPANIVPGMGFSSDRMLQARLVSYPDAHRHRLGVYYAALPVNRPRCPVHTYHRDGQRRFDDNGGFTPNDEPNSFAGPVQDERFVEPPLRISGDAYRYDPRVGNDDYTQAGNLFRLLSASEQERLVETITVSMSTVPREIQVRQLRHFLKADPAYGAAVACALGIART